MRVIRLHGRVELGVERIGDSFHIIRVNITDFALHIRHVQVHTGLEIAYRIIIGCNAAGETLIVRGKHVAVFLKISK